MFLSMCDSADAVHRRPRWGWSAADRRSQMASSSGGECTKHPEGDHTDVQRCRPVKQKKTKSSTSVCFSFFTVCHYSIEIFIVAICFSFLSAYCHFSLFYALSLFSLFHEKTVFLTFLSPKCSPPEWGLWRCTYAGYSSQGLFFQPDIHTFITNPSYQWHNWSQSRKCHTPPSP